MIGLVSLMHGAYGAIIGQILGLCGAALVSLGLLYLTIITKIRKQKTELQFISTIKNLLTYGLPLSIVSILGGVLSQFYIFVSAIYVTDQMMSNYSMAVYFGTLVSVFTTSVATVMFPTFSKIKGKDDTKTLQSVFQYSVKYTSLIIIPLAFAIMALSTPGVQTLFPEDFAYTPQFLSLYCLSFLYCALGNLSVGSLINSQGETQVSMKIAILTFIFGVSLSLVLIPHFEIFGLIMSYMLAGLPGLLVSLVWIKKRYNATIDWISSIKIISVSAFSAVITYFAINQLTLARWIGLLFGAPLFFGIYIVVAPLSGAITYDDTRNLKDAMKSLGPLAIVIDLLLYPIEKISKARQNNKS
jgi:putative peptidoglycan lipid II flippase